MPSVQIYSTNSCKYCVQAKDFFKEHKVEFIEHNVSESEAKRDEMLVLTDGQRRVPVIVFENEVMVGFNENKARLSELFANT